MQRLLGFGLLVVFAELVLLQPVRAQFSGSYQTNIISGVVSNWDGDYFVGSNEVFDALQVVDGAVLNDAQGFIGYFGATNSVEVSGSGSLWSNDSDLRLGYFADDNQLLVSGGGAVVSRYGYAGLYGTHNRIQVSGFGSVLTSEAFYIGYFGGDNRLVVTNGGAVNGNVIVGFLADSNTALITGFGSVCSNVSALTVGSSGNGNSLAIRDGGAAFGNTGWIGINGATNNNVLVEGSGSVWSNTSDLLLGLNGGWSNTLVVQHGGTVINGNAQIGWEGTNNGVVVTGGGSVWNNADVFVGPRGAGNSVLISNSAALISESSYVGYSGTSNYIMVTGSGSTWSNQHTLYVGYGLESYGNFVTISDYGQVVASNIVVAANNSLVLKSANLTATDGLLISSGAILKGTGIISANLTLAGTLAPGNSAGAITNYGNVVLLPTAVLQFELAGTTQGSGYDFMLVTNGAVTLDGALQASFVNGFETNVSNSDTFTLLTVTGVLSGAFTNVADGARLVTAGGEGSFLVTYNGNELMLSNYQAIPEPSARILGELGLVILSILRRSTPRLFSPCIGLICG